MKFNTRNAYYLRVSENTILPLYVSLPPALRSEGSYSKSVVLQLYLDEQHVDWMSERVLQHVLADLRPL